MVKYTLYILFKYTLYILYIYFKSYICMNVVKNLPAMQETWVLSLGWEDPLEKGWLPTLVFLLGEFHE